MDFESLSSEKYLSLTTFRKNGEAVATPMWFIVREGDIYMRTLANSWKIKRLRNNPEVTLAACNVNGKNVHGATLPGTACLCEMSEQTWIERAHAVKYGLMWKVLKLGRMLVCRVRSGQEIALIKVVAGEPARL